MTDSPPNPEDGELWIPSDVFHEIVSSNTSPQMDSHISPLDDKSINAASVHVVHQPRKISLHKAKPKPTSQPYNCGFPGPTVLQPSGYGIPGAYHFNASFQQLPRPLHVYNPIFQPATQSQVARVQETTGNFAPKHGGTGVFLPPSATVQKSNHVQEKTTEKGGTEISLNHHPHTTIIPHKKKKSEKNSQWNPKTTATKKLLDTVEQKGEIQIASGKCLPKD